MKTRYYKGEELLDNEELLEELIDVLKEGQLVVFPTETVYGLGADVFNTEGIRSIYSVKGRPKDNPLILHIGRREQLDQMIDFLPEKAEILMTHFWPGPLTLILPEKPGFFPEGTGVNGTIGVRMPNHLVTEALLSHGNLILAAPSANLSGRPSPTTADHVKEDLDSKIFAIIDGGPSNEGIESTILSLVGEKPVILRPGSITKEMLESVLESSVEMDPSLLKYHPHIKNPLAPGMKYKHYAPKGEVFIISSKNCAQKIEDRIREKGIVKEKIALITFEEQLNYYNSLSIGHYFSLGNENKLQEVIHNFYSVLRECDKLGVELLFIQGVEEKGLGFSYMNRLKKAANYNYLDRGN